MTSEDIIKILGGWEGYRTGTVGLVEKGRECWIELLPESKRGVCGSCGKKSCEIHDTTERWIDDLPVFGKPVKLLVHRRRVQCNDCGGPKLEKLEWLEPHQRCTVRFAEFVSRLCRVASVKHVADHYCIGWDRAKRIDKACLQRDLDPVDLSDVSLLVMDEFAIQKGHRYATVIVDPTRKKVLWVGRGNGRKDIRPFFEMLGYEGRRRIQAVAMDMNTGFELEVKAQCPNAKVVFDLYHVVAKYNREVIDRVRVDEANRLREDKPARTVVKSSRWLLLRNAENLKPEQKVKLAELLEANKILMTTYVLKDDLKSLWCFKCDEEARKFWSGWLHRVKQSGIKPLMKFAVNLLTRIEDVFSHCFYPLHTSLIEGINNKIKVIKRMAYGFRDDEYFFLKIKQAFPGNRG